MADVTSIIDYYVGLLIIQYNQKPKARATIEACIDALIANGIALDVRDGYDLDTAVGSQLDVLGKYIGLDRFYLSSELTDFYFGFANATDLGGTSANIVGFDDAASPDKTGLFLDADEVIAKELVLNDDAYRTLLKLKIVQNYSNHSFESIVAGMHQFFADTIIPTDNYNMTISYLVGDASTALIKAALQKQVFPKPMGVGMQVIDGISFFGFSDATRTDLIPDYVVGFNDAASMIKEGGFLNANDDIIT